MIVVGGWPGRIVVGLNGHFGVLPAALATGGTDDPPLLNDIYAGDENTEFAWVIRSPLPASGTLTAWDDGGMSLVGAADGVYRVDYGVYAAADGAAAAYHGDSYFEATIGAAAATATGVLAAAEGASDTAAIAGQVGVAGAVVAAEGSSDAALIVGGELPPIAGFLAAVEGAADHAAIGDALPVSTPWVWRGDPNSRIAVDLGGLAILADGRMALVH